MRKRGREWAVAAAVAWPLLLVLAFEAWMLLREW